MKLVVAGTRNMRITVVDLQSLLILHDLDRKTKQIISGGATGIDTTAKYHAAAYGFDFLEIPADWNMYGKAAGPIRNAKMAAVGDALLLIWDGQSSGSRNMKEQMMKLKKPVYEVILRKYNA